MSAHPDQSAPVSGSLDTRVSDARVSRPRDARASGTLDSRVAVTPFISASDYLPMVDYFLGADERSLQAMGVDPKKLPHRDAWLWEGRLQGDSIRCPLHGFCYDLRSGEVTWPRGWDPVATYETRVDAGVVYLRVP